MVNRREQGGQAESRAYVLKELGRKLQRIVKLRPFRWFINEISVVHEFLRYRDRQYICERNGLR